MSRRINCIHHQPNPDAPGGWICGVGVLQRPSLGACENCDDPQKTPDPAFVPRAAVKSSKPKPAPVISMTIPRSEWPLPVRVLARLSIPSDKGIGDVVERWAEDTGVAWVVRSLWKECGCGRRRQSLNQRYPLTLAF